MPRRDQVIQVDDTYICLLSGIVMRGSFCSPQKCDSCGWNPKVHAERDAWYSGAIWVFRQISDEWDRNDPIWRGTR